LRQITTISFIFTYFNISYRHALTLSQQHSPV